MTERFTSATIGLKKMAFAVCTSAGSSVVNPTYGDIHICNGIVGADPETEEAPAVSFIGDKRWKYNPSKISVEKIALAPEIQKLMLGQTLTNGVLEKKQSDNSPIIALLWETKQANGKRVRWLLPYVKITSAEPNGLSTKSDSVDFQHYTLSGTYWHTLTGIKYRRAYEELNPAQFADWFTTIQF